MIDPETCSNCLEEVEDSTLTDMPNGMRVCRTCKRDHPRSYFSE